LRDYGYDIIVLTTCKKGDFHKELERNNIESYENEVISSNSLVYYLKQWMFLILFCKKHKINFLHSHLQQANIIAVFAQFFIKAKCTIFRHHCNFIVPGAKEQNRTEKFFDKIIHLLAKKIIIPSLGVKNEIEKNETTDIKKYIILPYIYDFSKYASPNDDVIDEIRKQYSAELLLLFSSRFIELKRPFVALNILKTLIGKGLDVKLLLLDEGPLKHDMQKYINDNNLSSRAFIIGFRRDYIDFFKACDILIHPSLTDASNSTVKEMALLEKCVITCRDTGDFDDYIVNNENGFLVSKENTTNETVKIVSELYENREKIRAVGSKLKYDVLNKFSSSTEIIERYIKETL
jgi:glycosyltransferase involved in cell wall biosynthesis